MLNKVFRFSNLLLNEIKPLKSSSSAAASIPSIISKRLPSGYNPLTTFGIFIQESIKKNNSLTKVEFSRLSKEWKLLSEEEKKRFVSLQKHKALEKLQEFNQLPEHQRTQKLQEHHEKRIQIILFRFFEKTDYPNCPLSIFDVYRRSIEAGKFSLDEIKEHFEELTDEEMKIYMDKFTQEMHEYHLAVKKWKQTHGHKFNVLKKKLHSSYNKHD
uniref:HMG box domain-containing protein n=1 Tax=Panagrolaimus sp. ES5 TaxID=591445 RepID=A0AC34FLK4_9BILA